MRMAFLKSPWPAHWGRNQRSNATMAVAVVAMILVLWLLARLVALAPEPIGVRADLLLTIVDALRTTNAVYLGRP